jgi:hypothetical protein
MGHLMEPQVEAALVGAMVAGALTLAGAIVSFLFQARHWRQESRKRDAEWRREKCNEAYSQAIYYLFKLQVSSAQNGLDDKDVRQHLSEGQRYLSLLQAYHPDADARRTLAVVAAALKDALHEPGDISAAAERACVAVEQSLQSTWSPTVRGSR